MRQRPPGDRARSPPSIGHSTAAFVTAALPNRRSSNGPSQSELSRARMSPKVSAGISARYRSRSSLPLTGWSAATESSTETAPSAHLTTSICSRNGPARVLRGRDGQSLAREGVRLFRRLPECAPTSRWSHQVGANGGQDPRGGRVLHRGDEG